MLREIVKEVKIKIKWKGGPDDYTSANKIENLIKSYDFYTDYIDSYAQKKKKDAKNDAIVNQLKEFGVTSFTNSDKSKDVK